MWRVATKEKCGSVLNRNGISSLVHREEMMDLSAGDSFVRTFRCSLVVSSSLKLAVGFRPRLLPVSA